MESPNIPPNPLGEGAFSLLVESTYTAGVSQTLTWYVSGKTYKRLCTNTNDDEWIEWIPLATATTPQEFDLPLVEGITGYAKYSKDQFGHVLIMLQDIKRDDGLALGDSQIETIAMIPSGFRSSRDIYTNAVATGSAGTPILGIYQLWLYADGRVCCLAESGISPVKLRGALWYAAAD